MLLLNRTWREGAEIEGFLRDEAEPIQSDAFQLWGEAEAPTAEIWFLLSLPNEPGKKLGLEQCITSCGILRCGKEWSNGRSAREHGS